ncbi:MAG TPA: glycoside hydrolase family 20 zincin-like fold domain-containing protein [Candidatus Hydrogenedentes bacterium]|nr:glycoside hydrolase family 20 zincin-like fold domain-containing protein [Candidatus Hydrogenedentota bacterium]
MTRNHCTIISLFLISACFTAPIPAQESVQNTAEEVSKTLTSLDTWILAQPKVVQALPGVSFDITSAKGISIKPENQQTSELAQWAAARLAVALGVELSVGTDYTEGPVIDLVLGEEAKKIMILAKTGDMPGDLHVEQGYALVINHAGITLAARSLAGLRYGVTTLAQIATDRTLLPGMTIYDWPSLKYRGIQQDISRGQVPKLETLKKLSEVCAWAKMNQMEFYLEHVYKYKAFPDISPPEGLTPEEGKEWSAHAARLGVEVHPLFQGLGHSYHILSKPQYQHLRIGPSENMPWIMTFDIRKPEAVQMVCAMIGELCETFPGELFNIDITEIDIDDLQKEGITLEQVTDLVFKYVLQLNDEVKKHNRRLMITQGPLDSQGHLAGMGPKLDLLPKDIIIGSYYCAGGPYQPAWEKDFPRLHEKGFEFFAQPWIYSHVWLTPWVNKAAEFSDLEVSRGVQHGASGSITTDWGDAGHFHFVGEEWLPFVYHGACAWNGGNLDREYFRKAYARIVYGLPDDAAVRAMERASDVNALLIKVRDKDGKETEVSTSFIWEFVHDPFTHAEITRIADPAAVGQKILDRASPALATLHAQSAKVRRNQENYEQWIFGVRYYVALGHKLLALGHYNDATVPRKQAADDLDTVATEFETLQTDFKRLWLAEDRNNDGFQDLVKRFTYTSVPCREKATALRVALP